jgi:hypothetical protein
MLPDAFKNSKIVIFLGAGASAFSGYKTFQDFRDLIFKEEVKNDENLPQIHPSTPPLLAEIESVLPYDNKYPTHDNYLWALINYMKLCQTFEDHQLVKRRFGDTSLNIGSFFAEVNNAIDDITRITMHHYSRNRVELAKNQKNPLVNSMIRVADFYIRLAEVNSPKEPYLPIFTTNYDILLEDIYSDPEIIKTSFNLITGINSLDNEGIAWNHEEFGKHNLPAIHLFRLHGCVCWFYTIDNDPTVFYYRRGCLNQNWKSKLCVMLPGREIYRGKYPHAFGFRQLFIMLQRCKLVIFIGFSFRDDDVMHLLLAANGERNEQEPLTIINVNPILGTHEIINLMRLAGDRSAFPVRIMDSNNIFSINCEFGRGRFDEVILNEVNKLM